MKVLQFPLARITLVFVSAILISNYLKLQPALAKIVLVLSISSFSIAYFLLRKKFTKTIYFGITTYLLAFAIGIITQITHTDSYQENNYIHNKSAFEKPHKNAKFQAKRAVMKQDETVKTQIPTMKPKD